jgi:hypothetical protein
MVTAQAPLQAIPVYLHEDLTILRMSVATIDGSLQPDIDSGNIGTIPAVLSRREDMDHEDRNPHLLDVERIRGS